MTHPGGVDSKGFRTACGSLCQLQCSILIFASELMWVSMMHFHLRKYPVIVLMIRRYSNNYLFSRLLTEISIIGTLCSCNLSPQYRDTIGFYSYSVEYIIRLCLCNIFEYVHYSHVNLYRYTATPSSHSLTPAPPSSNSSHAHTPFTHSY